MCFSVGLGSYSIQTGMHQQPAANILFENKYFTMHQWEHKAQLYNRSIEKFFHALNDFIQRRIIFALYSTVVIRQMCRLPEGGD